MRGFEDPKCSMWQIVLMMTAFAFVVTGCTAFGQWHEFGSIPSMQKSLLLGLGSVLALAGALYALRAAGTFIAELWHDVEFEDPDMADAIATERFRELPR